MITLKNNRSEIKMLAQADDFCLLLLDKLSIDLKIKHFVWSLVKRRKYLKIQILHLIIINNVKIQKKIIDHRRYGIFW